MKIPKTQIQEPFPKPAIPVTVLVGVAISKVGGAVGVTLGGGGVLVGGRAVGVLVAGGVTNNNNFWFGLIIDESDKPFQTINSLTETLYCLAIQERVSPLRTVW